jgi:hypothetical protein
LASRIAPRAKSAKPQAGGHAVAWVSFLGEEDVSQRLPLPGANNEKPAIRWANEFWLLSPLIPLAIGHFLRTRSQSHSEFF